MNYWLAQFLSALGGPPFCLWQEAGGLAARNSNEKDTGWAQILGFVILAIFYAVGSIVKARANKTAPKGEKQIPRKPARKPPDLQILKQFFGLPEEPESSSQPSPEASEPLVRAKRPAVARQAAMPSAFSETSPLGGQVQPKLEKVTAGVAAPLVTAERAIAGAEILQTNATLRSAYSAEADASAAKAGTLRSTRYLSEILSDYDDPEKLRRAILHYEILGKPLSLRDQSEHIIEL
jgi:hypothetical protein